ncbi:MAG TPA: hypothetical protein VHC49_18105 [Mycobacteriales bacterium]|nr:hypothetical protein [Mycobacteriales bacterium]
MVTKISRRNLLLAASAGAGLAAIPGGTASAFPPVARTAAEFLDSLGVGTHMGQGVDAAPGVATALSYLGIKNIRDDGNLAHVPDWIELHRRSGARVDLLTNHDLDQTMQMARDLRAAGALLAVEGPNEPNNWPVTYEGKTSGFDTTFLPVAHLQRDLYRAVHADSRLAGIPVFTSSEAGGSEPDDVGLQFLQVPEGTLMPAGTRYADFANTHTYPQGHTGNWVDNIAWNAADPTLDGDWDGLYVEFGHTWHGGFAGYSPAELITLPRVMTETGWTTQGDGSISEDRQGRLHLCLYLANFARGWSHTFIYMLRDDPAQGLLGSRRHRLPAQDLRSLRPQPHGHPRRPRRREDELPCAVHDCGPYPHGARPATARPRRTRGPGLERAEHRLGRPRRGSGPGVRHGRGLRPDGRHRTRPAAAERPVGRSDPGRLRGRDTEILSVARCARRPRLMIMLNLSL